MKNETKIRIESQIIENYTRIYGDKNCIAASIC